MALRRKKPAGEPQSVDPEVIARALAKAIREGDIVNFRLLFLPFSPARADSPEDFQTDKYAYLLPDDDMEGDFSFQDTLHQIRKPDAWAQIQRELEANRPAQMPSALLLQLADNAVRAGKYTSAAQAYELLRIRGRMQETFFAQADEALDGQDVNSAVRGYIIATGLDYNFAAFPEPLPVVPDFQTRALMLHGEYPERPEDCLPLQEHETFLRTALSYLLVSPEAGARLDARPTPLKIEFLKALVLQRDPDWHAFAGRYREACGMMRDFEKRIDRATREGARGPGDLAEEIEELLGADPIAIPQRLLGRPAEGGEWWQYLRELAYRHPAGILFVSRQLVGEIEILVPRYRADSPVPGQLGLVPDAAE